MNSTTIIDIPPRVIRPLAFSPAPAFVAPPAAFGGGDDLRQLAQEIVRHDPALALLLARAGHRVRRS